MMVYSASLNADVVAVSLKLSHFNSYRFLAEVTSYGVAVGNVVTKHHDV